MVWKLLLSVVMAVIGFFVTNSVVGEDQTPSVATDIDIIAETSDVATENDVTPSTPEDKVSTNVTVKVVEQECEVIFWFRSTPKWVIYAHDPKAEDPMLAAILEKIPKGQLDPDYPEPPVRLFANAVRGGAGEYYVLWSIFYLLTLPILLMGIIGQSWIMTLIVLGVMAIWTVYMVLAVCSAKRAHASEKWANVAKFCWKKGVLRP